MTQITRIDGKIFLALRSHLAGWTECPVYYSPDAPQSPDVSEPYLVVTDMRLEFDTRFTGDDDPDEYRGVLNIAVMYPIENAQGVVVGDPHTNGLGLASEVCDHFHKGLAMTYDDCTVKVMARPKIMGAPYQDAGRMRFPVNVRWRSSG